MSDDWLEWFRHYGAVQAGHFLLTSGLHSPAYIQCALILQHPTEAARLGAALAERAREVHPDVVVGPAMGGIIVAHEVARALGVRAIFAERAGAEMTLRRGFAVAAGERALIVEDVITTGGSVEEVAGLVRSAGARVVGMAALVDRGGSRARFGVPCWTLITLDLPAYRPEACPLCLAGDPPVKPGSRSSPAVGSVPGRPHM